MQAYSEVSALLFSRAYSPKIVLRTATISSCRSRCSLTRNSGEAFKDSVYCVMKVIYIKLSFYSVRSTTSHFSIKKLHVYIPFHPNQHWIIQSLIHQERERTTNVQIQFPSQSLHTNLLTSQCKPKCEPYSATSSKGCSFPKRGL